jgi:hypothetical protein
MMEEDIVKIFVHMATSARGCIDEPKNYGPLRLVEAMLELYTILKKNNKYDIRDLDKIMDKLKTNIYDVYTDEVALVRLLDEVVDDFVDLMMG